MKTIVGFLRFICGVTYAVLYLILGIPVLVVEYFIGRRSRYREDISSLHLVQWGFRCINRICGVTFTTIGHENVPTDRPVLYVANHNSYFDILISYTLCQDRTGYIAKSSLKKVPLLNIWMKRLYCLFIDRDDMKQSMRTIQQAIDLINNGISVTIFPEGTRGDSEEMIPFKSASFRVAEKTGCPVIPIAISGTRNILGYTTPSVRPTHVTLQYGDPIYTDQMTREEKKSLSTMTRDIIQKMLDEIGERPVPGLQTQNNIRTKSTLEMP